MLDKYKKLDPEALEKRIWYLENAIVRLSDRLDVIRKAQLDIEILDVDRVRIAKLERIMEEFMESDFMRGSKPYILWRRVDKKTYPTHD